MENPLPSWNEGATKTAIINFVENIATKYEPKDRIATFDNDGTLWSERPEYFQAYFIESNLPSGKKITGKKVPLTKEELLRIDADFYPDISTEDYTSAAADFVTTTNHPDDKFSNYKFVEMTYKAVIELLDYLRANEFKVYICSGGGRDFVRSFAENAYGIPPENVIGSSIVTEYNEDAKAVFRTKVLETDPRGQVDKGLGQYNDQEGKPVGIQRQIGKRPILAVGNSSGDLEMFDYTDQGAENSLIVIINHDDPVREFQYNDDPDEENPAHATDPSEDEYMNESLHKAQTLDHWIVASMKDDFNKMFTADS